MNALQVKNDMDLTTPMAKMELSPYDPSYPIVLLSNGLKKGIQEADDVCSDCDAEHPDITPRFPVPACVGKQHDDCCSC